MKKKWVIPIAILSVLLIAILIIFFMITGSSTVAAQLNVEAGSVMLNGNTVSGNVKVSEGDSIETGADGEATVILYESVIVSLDPSTKITIDELKKSHPKITQESGSTWNKFTKLFGVEDYTVTSGNSVASVRGTSFLIGEDSIIVSEGEVAYDVEGQQFLVKGKVVEKVNNQIVERELTEQDRVMIRKKIQRTINQLSHLREAELDKHPRVLSIIKSRYDLDDEKIRRRFRDADEGMINLRDYRDKSPVDIKSIDKIIEITDKIKELKQQTI